MTDAIRARTIEITGGSGTPIEAYYAQPESGQRRGSMVVVHHLPGYDPASKEIVRTFADAGYATICPNLYSREAGGMPWRDAAAKVRAAGGVPDAQVVADVAAAANFMRAQEHSNGKVGVIGYCSGGRQAVLAACRLDLDALVDCYGAFVMRTAGPESGLARRGFPELIENLSCPMLGLFGEEDPAPPVEEVQELEAALKEHGKEYTIRIMPNAGHAFFSVDSEKYRPLAARDGWAEIFTFLQRQLS